MQCSGEDQSGENRARDRGQATVEFALVLPLLLICLAGLVWVGNIMAMQVRLEHAAREGARAAAVEPERADSVSREAVQRSMSTASSTSRIEGDFVVVEVSIDVPGVPIIGVGARRLSADAVMAREDLFDEVAQ